MRIIAGKCGGRRIEAPRTASVRPTSDKVRGAVFNALESRGAVTGAVVLDGFCGSGALGLEALSRGAHRCTFIDRARTSLDAARRNAEKLGLQDKAGFLLKDMRKIGQNPENIKFSLVFLDPPYKKHLAGPVLKVLSQYNYPAPGCIVILETEKDFQAAAAQIPGEIYTVLDERVYGDTKIITLAYKASR